MTDYHTPSAWVVHSDGDIPAAEVTRDSVCLLYTSVSGKWVYCMQLSKGAGLAILCGEGIVLVLQV